MNRVSPFVTLCFVGALAAFSATIVRNPVLPPFTASLGVDDATLGLIASVSAATDVLVGASAVAAMPITTSYWAVLALSCLFGLTVAAVTGSTSALVSDFSRSSAYSSSLGILNSIKDVGHGAGPAVAGFLVMRWSYGPAFAMVGGVMPLGALAFYLLVRDPAPAR